MMSIQLLSIVLFLLFFALNMGWSQRLYLSRHLAKISIPLIIIIPLCSFLISKQESRFDGLNFGFLIPYYFLLLLAIRKWYNTLNDFLIKRRLVQLKFKGKVFTYVNWGGGTIGAYWDEKRVTAPSLLDHALTFILFFLPILLTLPYIYLIKNIR